MSSSSAVPTRPARRRQPLPEQIYRTLVRKIASGAIDPAGHLTETRLAAWFGVSRTPVREALVRLRREGLLQRTPPSPGGTPISREDLDEIMELRLLVDPFAAARAAERATPQDLAELDAARDAEARAASLSGTYRFAIANHQFRQCLLRVAGNRRLAEVASRYDVQLHALRLRTLRSRVHRDVVLDGHRALVEAVRAGDPVGAESAMRDLIRRAGEAVFALAAVGRPRNHGR